MSVDLHEVLGPSRGQGRKETAGIAPCQFTLWVTPVRALDEGSAASFPRAGTRMGAGSQGAADHAHPHLPSFTPIAQTKSWSPEDKLKGAHFTHADKVCGSAV